MTSLPAKSASETFFPLASATVNAGGRPFGFPPAPASPLRFWLSLAVAYMMLVTLLAAAIARDPRARAHLMPILAAGKATSSLACAGYFVASSPAFIYLANALVDGTLALVVLGAYGVVWATSGTGGARDRQLLQAVLEALVPRGGALATGAAGRPPPGPPLPPLRP